MFSPPAHPVKVGIVGTGYAAQRRAEAFLQDDRAQLCFVAGHSAEKIASFCQNYGVSSFDAWETLVNHPQVDLVVICNVNRDHGAIADAALTSGKHVIIEYPLALDTSVAAQLIDLAQKAQKLLHVEHLELLGGMHQETRQHLAYLGNVFYARYTTIDPQRPAPRRWSYHRQLFGFPLMAALPRIHRFTDLFGQVKAVTCQERYWDAPEAGYFTACLCVAQLQFTSGLTVDLVYGKGEVFWQGDRTFALQGDKGTLIFNGDVGQLTSEKESKTVELGALRGLFAKDTHLALDCLFEGTPLYVTPRSSLYALQVAQAAFESAQTGRTIMLAND